MFSRKVVTVIELSDETKQSLTQLDNDVQILQELLQEVVGNSNAIIAALHGEIVSSIPSSNGVDTEREGVEVFADPETEKSVKHSHRDKKAKKLAEINPYATRVEFDSRTPEDERVRATPFSRTSRPVQIAWLREVLSDGEWHTSWDISHAYSDDSRQAGYMNRAISGRLREMWEEGETERRSTASNRSYYEYRLKK